MSTERLKNLSKREKLIGAGVGLALAAGALAGCKAEVAEAKAPDSSTTPNVEQTIDEQPQTNETEQAQETLTVDSFRIQSGLSDEAFAEAYLNDIDLWLNADSGNKITDIIVSNLDKTNEEIYDNLNSDYSSMFIDALFPEDWKNDTRFVDFIEHYSDAYKSNLDFSFRNRDNLDAVSPIDHSLSSTSVRDLDDGRREITISGSATERDGSVNEFTHKLIVDDSGEDSQITDVVSLG